MLMNRTETLMVNSPPRRWLQRLYEAPALARLSGPIPGGHAVEIGCGCGYGTHLILDVFKAGTVHAVDLDPTMIERARRRLARYGDRVRLAVGDATDLRAALNADDAGHDAGYDAVFDFGIIHHIPHWRAAIAEAARVLKPGGRFYFEEITAHALNRRSYQLLFDHPRHDRFTTDDFTGELQRCGMTIRASRTMFFGDFLLGVAETPALH